MASPARCDYTRIYKLGYRSREVQIKEVPAITACTSFRVKMYQLQKPHMLCGRSLGCHVQGFSNPSPDVNDQGTMLHGILCRFAAESPPMEEFHRHTLIAFVDKMLEKYLKPIPVDYNLSHKEWLSHTHYTAVRRAQLRENWKAGSRHTPTKRERRNKSFGKHESYGKYKPARGINSRTDYWKNFSGPYFKAIENSLFALPFFVKHCPIQDRPAFLKERIYSVGANYYCTDFSSFESLFTPDLMNMIEFRLYRYMLKNHAEVAETICQTLGGINQCRFNTIQVNVPGKRMSGEMATSLGNGFTNWILCSYLCDLHNSECIGVFEGDDGIFRVNGSYIPNKDDFEKLGWRIKIDVVRSFSEASFCGLIADEEELATTTDPVRAILNFGWTSSAMKHGGPKVIRGLLRSKALSLRAEYPRSPILTALAERYIYLTSDVEAVYDDNTWFGRMKRARDHFNHEDALNIKAGTIGPRTRQLVERKFGISISEQLILEEYFSKMELDQCMDLPLLLEIIDRDAKESCNIHRADYFHRYIATFKAGSLFTEIP